MSEGTSIFCSLRTTILEDVSFGRKDPRILRLQVYLVVGEKEEKYHSGAHHILLWCASYYAKNNEEVRRMDGDLLEDVYDRYAPMVLALARAKMPAQDAEDVLCGVMERLLPHLPRLADMAEPQRKAYVFAAARSEVADRLRSRARDAANTVPYELLPAEPADSDAAETALKQADIRALRRAVSRLSDEHRLLLEMRYVLEMDHGQIGRRLGMRPDAVRQQLLRLRRKLKRWMEEE